MNKELIDGSVKTSSVHSAFLVFSNGLCMFGVELLWDISKWIVLFNIISINVIIIREGTNQQLFIQIVYHTNILHK